MPCDQDWVRQSYRKKLSQRFWLLFESENKLRPKHIGVFLPSLGGGGAERVGINLVRGFSEKGLKTDLVLAKAEGPYLNLVPAGVRVVNFCASRILTALHKLVEYLKRENPEALIVGLTHANLIALWAKRLARVPSKIIVTEHNTISEADRHNLLLRGKVVARLAKLFYPWADVVITVSNGVADDLTQTMRVKTRKLQVIYNPVVVPEIFEMTREVPSHSWFQCSETPIVLSVGRLTKQKDFPTLIRAFALVLKKQNARLMILGEGEDRKMLESLIVQLRLEHCVALPGFVSNPYAYMAHSNVFVLSSIYESFGNVLVEALAVNTPIVSTDCPNGPAEILEWGKWGKLVPVRDVVAMAAAITQSIQKPIELDATIRAQDFRYDAICTEYIQTCLEK